MNCHKNTGSRGSLEGLNDTTEGQAPSRQRRSRRLIAAHLTQDLCYRHLAQMYRLSGHWEEAVSAARKAVTHAPEKAESREVLVSLLLERGDFENAIRESLEWLELDSCSFGALEALAAAYWQKVDFKAAVKVYTRLLALNPHEIEYRLQRGLLYQYLDCWTLAMQDFLQAQRMALTEEMRLKAQNALDTLDKIQVRRITQLIWECPLFRQDFKRNREEAVTLRGFALSERGWDFVNWLQTDWANTDLLPDRIYVPFD